MKKNWFVFLVLWGISACQPQDKNQNARDEFYTTLSDWDIIYVPIIPPFRASSTHTGYWSIGGGKGLITQDETHHGDIAVLSFGVTECYVFGTMPKGYSQEVDKWFLFNTTTGSFSSFGDEAALDTELKGLGLKKTGIQSCDQYYKTLADGGPCYWFPVNGKKTCGN